MSVDATIFGTPYLDAEAFRLNTALFGVGMAMAEFGEPSDEKLTHALTAASRMVDAHCGKVFTSGNITEQHPFDPADMQFRVNNGPVSSIVSCLIRTGIGESITIDPARCYINNQKRYIEIAQDYFQSVVFAVAPRKLVDPVIEIVYKSLQSVPEAVKLATGYQAAHMINTGFVDKTIPPNFGKLDITGLSMNNKKGSRSSEELEAATLCETARSLLSSHVSFVAA